MEQCGQKGGFILFCGIFGLKGGSDFWRWGFVGFILKRGSLENFPTTGKMSSFDPKRNRFFKNENLFLEIFFLLNYNFLKFEKYFMHKNAIKKVGGVKISEFSP